MNDREKLIELIESARYWGSNTSAEIADHLIANNVVIQKQGEWVEHPHFNFEGGYNGADYECSECHYNDDIYEPLPYCPNCGAKMKEVK